MSAHSQIRALAMAKLLVLVTSLIFVFCNAHLRAAETNDPITLAQGFERVLAHDPELLRLRKDVERASGTKLIIHARDLAQVNAQGYLGLDGGHLYRPDAKIRPFALVTAQFSQPLLNTAIPANWRRGNLEFLATEQNLNANICGRLHQFRSQYIHAQQLHQLITVYEELGRRLQQNVDAEQQRRDVGTIGPRPLLQAKVQLLAERAELTEFRRQEFTVRSEMALMMDEPPGVLPIPSEPLASQPMKVDLKADTELAERQRADLKFLRMLIRMADEDKKFVESGYFPAISAIASTEYLPGKQPLYQATPLIYGQQPLGTDYRGGLNLTWQIIDNGRVTGVKRQIEGVRGEYQVILEHIQQDIPRDLERAAHSLDDADARLAALMKSISAAEEGLRLIESHIQLGEATQLDFSNAQRNLLAVRHGVVDALYQQALARADVDLATGRYLEFADATKSQ